MPAEPQQRGAEEAPQPFYIAAHDSLVDEPPRTLKHGDTFALFDHYGDLASRRGNSLGLYHKDTRYLSRLKLTVEKAQPAAAVLDRAHQQRRARRRPHQPGHQARRDAGARQGHGASRRAPNSCGMAAATRCSALRNLRRGDGCGCCSTSTSMRISPTCSRSAASSARRAGAVTADARGARRGALRLRRRSTGCARVTDVVFYAGAARAHAAARDVRARAAAQERIAVIMMHPLLTMGAGWTRAPCVSRHARRAPGVARCDAPRRRRGDLQQPRQRSAVPLDGRHQHAGHRHGARSLSVCRRAVVLHRLRARRHHHRDADAVAVSGAGARRAAIPGRVPGDQRAIRARDAEPGKILHETRKGELGASRAKCRSAATTAPSTRRRCSSRSPGLYWQHTGDRADASTPSGRTSWRRSTGSSATAMRMATASSSIGGGSDSGLRQPGLEGLGRRRVPRRRPARRGADRAVRGAGLCLPRAHVGGAHGGGARRAGCLPRGSRDQARIAAREVRGAVLGR